MARARASRCPRSMTWPGRSLPGAGSGRRAGSSRRPPRLRDDGSAGGRAARGRRRRCGPAGRRSRRTAGRTRRGCTPGKPRRKVPQCGLDVGAGQSDVSREREKVPAPQPGILAIELQRHAVAGETGKDAGGDRVIERCQPAGRERLRLGFGRPEDREVLQVHVAITDQPGEDGAAKQDIEVCGQAGRPRRRSAPFTTGCASMGVDPRGSMTGHPGGRVMHTEGPHGPEVPRTCQRVHGERPPQARRRRWTPLTLLSCRPAAAVCVRSHSTLIRRRTNSSGSWGPRLVSRPRC